MSSHGHQYSLQSTLDTCYLNKCLNCTCVKEICAPHKKQK